MSVLDRFDGDIVRALRFQDDEILEMAADEIERLREALRVYSCSCSEEVASNCRVDECGWIAQTALQQKDSE